MIVPKIDYLFSYRRVKQSGLFDARWYQLKYRDVALSGGGLLSHYMKYGATELRAPSRQFNVEKYVKHFPEVVEHELNPILHYVGIGSKSSYVLEDNLPSEADTIFESDLFDEAWYLDEYQDVKETGHDAFVHFVLHGRFEGRSPGPNFDANWYLKNNNDVLDDPLLHFLNSGLYEGRSPKRPTEALRQISDFVTYFSSIDRDFAETQGYGDLDAVMTTTGHRKTAVSEAINSARAQINIRPRCIVFLPWLVHGGADLVAGHAIKTIQNANGIDETLVILTGSDRFEATHLIPKGTKLISLSTINSELDDEERVEIVSVLIRTLKPQSILNINSHACWESIRISGQYFSQFVDLYAMLFCYEYDEASNAPTGYAKDYYQQCLPWLKKVYFDNQTFIETLVADFNTPRSLQEKLCVLYQPIDGAEREHQLARRNDDRLQVYWAGRFCKQKNTDLLLKIIEGSPSMDFHIWGRGPQDEEQALKAAAANMPWMHFHGAFSHHASLPLDEYDALLYTSLWDGIPNVLLEAANLGMPIVSSHVGGIRELINEKTGWLISDFNFSMAYILALQEVFENPIEVEKRCINMRTHLASQHNWKNYKSALLAKPSMVEEQVDHD